MTLPTNKPNEVSDHIIFPNAADSSWGRAMNDNLELLASQVDIYKVEVANNVKAIEETVAGHFETLRETMNSTAEEYIVAIKDNREDAMLTLKATIDSKIEIAVNDLVANTLSQLSEVDEIKEILSLGINRIQTEFHLAKGYISSGLDRTLKEMVNEVETTAATKEKLVNRVKTVREVLINHVANFDNPHEFDSSKLENGKSVYQPDPTGQDAIFPLKESDVMDIDDDEDAASTGVVEIDDTPRAEVADPEDLILRLNSKFLRLQDTEVPTDVYHYNFGAANANSAFGIEPYTARFQRRITGDMSVAPSTPEELKLEWVDPDIYRGNGDFDVLVFQPIDSVVQDPVTINVYAANAVTPVRTITTNIVRENYTDKPTLIDAIIVRTDYIPPASSSSGASSSSSSGGSTPSFDYQVRSFTNDYLRLKTVTSSYQTTEFRSVRSEGFITTFVWEPVTADKLFHWESESDDTDTYHESVLSVPAIRTIDQKEVPFDVPAAYKKVVGDSWEEVEACALATASEDGAAYYDETRDALVIFFKPNSNNVSHEYIIEFDDNANPITEGNVVTVTWRKWDLEAGLANNDSYEPETVATGTAETLL